MAHPPEAMPPFSVHSSAVKHWPLLAPLCVVIELLVQATFSNVTTLNKLKAGEKEMG